MLLLPTTTLLALFPIILSYSDEFSYTLENPDYPYFIPMIQEELLENFLKTDLDLFKLVLFISDESWCRKLNIEKNIVTSKKHAHAERTAFAAPSLLPLTRCADRP